MKLIATTIIGMSLVCSNAYAADNTPVQSSPESTTNGQSTAMKNQKAGEAFLAANKNKPGVVTLPDGLQYKVEKTGTGPIPTDNDVVTVDYSGALINGTEFDSSYKRGKPAIFQVSGVIPGWVEALKMMKAGSTWTLYIPPSLAYGDQGAPPIIGPNETLIFNVHLIDVKKQ